VALLHGRAQVRGHGAGHVHGPLLGRGVAVAQDGLRGAHQRVAGLEGIHAHPLAGYGVLKGDFGAMHEKEVRVSRYKRAEGVGSY